MQAFQRFKIQVRHTMLPHAQMFILYLFISDSRHRHRTGHPSASASNHLSIKPPQREHKQPQHRTKHQSIPGMSDSDADRSGYQIEAESDCFSYSNKHMRGTSVPRT